jgi:predicted Rossmann-fold nucleotide-binding protein
MTAECRKVVAVIGSGHTTHKGLCEDIGKLIAETGCDLLTGGGAGVMAAVSEAFCRHRKEGSRQVIVGIVPAEDLPRHEDSRLSHAAKIGYPNKWVELAIYTHLPLSGAQGTDTLSRNHIIVLSANAIIALPGGEGTKSEMRLAQTYGKPVIVYGEHACGNVPEGIERATSLAAVRAFLEKHLPVSRR